MDSSCDCGIEVPKSREPSRSRRSPPCSLRSSRSTWQRTSSRSPSRASPEKSLSAIDCRARSSSVLRRAPTRSRSPRSDRLRSPLGPQAATARPPAGAVATAGRPSAIATATRPIAPMPRRCSKPRATRRSGRFRSRPWPSRRSRPCIDCARPGWRRARPASTPCAGFCASSASPIPLGATEVTAHVIGLLADPESAIPLALRAVLGEACEEIDQLERASASSSANSKLSPRRSPPSAICARSRASDCSPQLGPGRLRRRRAPFPHRSPLRQLPRSHSQGTLQRQSAATGTDLQARRHLSAHALDSRCSSRPARRSRSQFALRHCTLGRSPSSSAWSQRRRYRARQQARPHRLGGVASGTLFQARPKRLNLRRSPTDDCRENDRRDGATGPTGAGRADNNRGPPRPLAAIGCSARLSILARSPKLTQWPETRLQSSPLRPNEIRPRFDGGKDQERTCGRSPNTNCYAALTLKPHRSTKTLEPLLLNPEDFPREAQWPLG